MNRTGRRGRAGPNNPFLNQGGAKLPFLSVFPSGKLDFYLNQMKIIRLYGQLCGGAVLAANTVSTGLSWIVTLQDTTEGKEVIHL